ncbi:MAG: IS1595 family transposase, partial [Polaribacter sp.]
YSIKQVKSNKGKSFKKLHIIIHQVKFWLRTIPTHVSKQHIQKYFDSFSKRINRLESKKTIRHNTII